MAGKIGDKIVTRNLDGSKRGMSVNNRMEVRPSKKGNRKKKLRVKGRILRPTGRATPGEKTPTVGKDKGVRQKIVPGFKGLIKKRKQLIN